MPIGGIQEADAVFELGHLDFRDGPAGDLGEQRRGDDGDDGGRHERDRFRRVDLPRDHDRDRREAEDAGGLRPGHLRLAEGGLDRGRDRQQRVEDLVGRGGVEEDVELLGEDDEADAGQHAEDHGGRHGAEPLAELQDAGEELQEAAQHHDPAESDEAVGLVDVIQDEHDEAGGRAADLERAAGERADDEPADDPGDEAGFRRQTAGLRDGDAQRQRHHEDDERSEKIGEEGPGFRFGVLGH